MKYILVIPLIILQIQSYGQEDPFKVYYDNDSNRYVIANGDTQYLQRLYTKRSENDGLPNFGENAVIVNTDKNYKYNPHFRGSIAEYIEKNMRYPQEAVSKGIEGKVTVTFVVDEQGHLHNIKTGWLHKQEDSILAKEAIRLVENMPRWRPARSREDDTSAVEALGGLTIPFELY